MKTMEDGDILIYHDTNTMKYKEYGIDVGSMRENCLRLFTDKTSVIAAIENPNDPNKINEHYIKPEVFEKLRSNEQSIKAPLLRCNRLFFKKDKLSVNFVENWLKLCETSLLYPERDTCKAWHTHDQALFNALYQKYVEMKLFRPPTFYFKNQIFSKDMIDTTERVKPTLVKPRTRPFMKFS
jgi:hypothetical protein